MKLIVLKSSEISGVEFFEGLKSLGVDDLELSGVAVAEWYKGDGVEYLELWELRLISLLALATVDELLLRGTTFRDWVSIVWGFKTVVELFSNGFSTVA